ncbi:chorismate-binding protein [Pararobbsia silviterrae]|uniref:Chorismate-utilising enzyme C-terminal domain-containing protein n=1 Tax=Pararobbsia silviterrae TaxID=1792498 RepID=A0A494XKF1_9BURK|nr:chorismate-binding protein [Pararobbsia silviterrae]RKP48629.1 hypothetical protein D7S86_21740 [Pararobbsia silviterrae]
MSFALLDDCEASAAHATSRLYTGFVRTLVSYGADDVERVCEEAAQAIDEGLHAVVVADYEWGALASDDHVARERVEQAQAGKPALRFVLYARCERLSREAVDRWLDDDAGLAGLANVSRDTTRERFDDAIAEIHAALERGDAYQINYTYRFGFETFGSPVALYRRLRARQPVRYGALIALPDARWVLSCSPELFLRHANGVLHAQPMKGTAARVAAHGAAHGATHVADYAVDRAADQRVREALAADPKNRAENLMIVDLLRNDLGRIARTGSVSTPELFSVDAYGDVWQMTSTVRAEARDGLTFAQMLRAMFPCGSITGAPKHRAMEIIAALETSPRGLYTGAIGWLDARAPGRRCGDFCLSVAIRTLVLEPGARVGRMGVGAGIVLDSVAASEWDECNVKAAFATGVDSGVGLFETMRATRGGVDHLDRHLARLARGVVALGMRVDLDAVRERIDAYVAALGEGVHRMRLAVDGTGRIDIGGGPLSPLHLSDGTDAPDASGQSRASRAQADAGDASSAVRACLADAHGFAPTDADDPLLRHKTTARETYDRAWRLAETHGAFDMLFFNARGELTEGGRSNVFVRLDGRWYTPALACGVLPGVMRGVLLDDPAWGATERVITRDELLRAEDIVICNALRGAMHARLIDV